MLWATRSPITGTGEESEVRVPGMKKCFSGVRRFIFPLLVLLLITAYYGICGTRVPQEFPELHPRNGVLDIKDVDFDSDVYHLVNEWDYYPGRILFPDVFDDPETAPKKNNESAMDVNKGTWRLRLLANPDTWLSLCSFSIDYSTRIFVNGSEVRNIGFVSDDPAEAVPKVRFVDLPLYSGDDGEIEIIYQYSNYVHNDGGFIQHTLISSPENIDEYQRGLSLNTVVISGGLMMLFFYFLLCAAFQKKREYAAMAVCCLVIALRDQFFFAEHLMPADYDFYTEYRLIVMDVSLIPMATLFLFAAFFTQAVRKKVILVFSGICMVLTALHFIVDTHDLVFLCHISYYICIPFAVWFLFRYLVSFRKQKIEVLDIFTLTAILFFTFILIREGITTGSDSAVNHFGITPLAMVVCILLLDIVNNEKMYRQASQLRDEQQRNELLRQLNTTNNDFLRTVAHELKTPLTVISGYAQLMERQIERGPLSEKTPERLKTIQNEADRLAEMVARLMDYTYGQANNVEMSAVDIDDLFRRVSAIMAPVCAKKKNTLTIKNDSTSRIHGNFELLLQVLINLIVNASRHTEDGLIAVDAKDNIGFVEITVSDTGEGIPPEAVPHIFEKSYSTDGSRGLGLAICMDTVQLHKGTLELAGTGPYGTVFRFKVPKEAAV